jgi:hypothetical protein
MNGMIQAVSVARAELERAGKRFALVGGLAVSARTEPRFTRDVDLAVQVDSDAEAEALARELMGSGFHDLRRPQDRLDLLALLRVAGEETRSAALAALRLIEQRGYQRDRDLQAAFRKLLAESSG